MPSRSTSKCYADPTWKIAVSTQCFLVVKCSSPLHPKPTFCIFCYLGGSKPNRFVSKTAIVSRETWVNLPKFPNLNVYLKFLAPPPTKTQHFSTWPHRLRALQNLSSSPTLLRPVAPQDVPNAASEGCRHHDLTIPKCSTGTGRYIYIYGLDLW